MIVFVLISHILVQSPRSHSLDYECRYDHPRFIIHVFVEYKEDSLYHDAIGCPQPSCGLLRALHTFLR